MIVVFQIIFIAWCAAVFGVLYFAWWLFFGKK
jgi:hypothetical protein